MIIMEILISVFIICVFIIAVLSTTISFLIICGILNFTSKWINFYAQVILYSLIVAIISFICIILIITP